MLVSQLSGIEHFCRVPVRLVSGTFHIFGRAQRRYSNEEKISIECFNNLHVYVRRFVRLHIHRK